MTIARQVQILLAVALVSTTAFTAKAEGLWATAWAGVRRVARRFRRPEISTVLKGGILHYLYPDGTTLPVMAGGAPMASEVKQRINQSVNELRRLRDSITERLNSGELVLGSEAHGSEMDRAEKMADAIDTMRAGIDRDVALDTRLESMTGFETSVPPQATPRNHETDALRRRYPAVAFTPEYTDAFDAYVRQYGIPTGFGATHKDVLREAVDPAGGVLVPPDRIGGILSRIRAASVMATIARVRPTSRDRIEQVRIEPASGTDGSIYSSGYIGSWVSETPAATAGEIEPSWGMLIIPIRKARSKTFLSNDLLADSDFDVISELTEDGGPNLGLVLDKGFINGSGVGEPMGLLNSPDITTVNVEGPTANTISNSTTDLGSATKLMDLQAAVPSQYVNRRWLTHRTNANKIRKLVDGNGRFLWAPGLADKPDDLLGEPVSLSDFVPLDGADTNRVIAYGDFSEAYLIGMRSLLSVQVNPFSHSDVEQTVLYLRARAGGDVRNPDAVRIGVV